jgi:dihydroorotate dehydrogenase (NAD+) catalytic subunit
VDLTSTVAGLSLPNPVMTAAGCAGAGRELDPFLDVSALGALVTRSVTLDPRSGGPAPRITETAGGVLSEGGLQNPGLQGFLATELPWLAQRRVRTIVSIAGSTLGEYAELARRVGQSPGVSAIEVNLSCPNADGRGDDFAADPYQTGKVLNVVRRDTPRGVAVLAKLAAAGPLVDVARAAVRAGADGLVLVSSLPGLAINPVSLRPTLGGVTGGLSGPAIHPLALRCVWDVHAAMPEVPLVGVGGVRTGSDALGFLLAGASAVQVGSATFHDPSAPARVVAELHDELAARNIHHVTDLIGRAHLPEGDQR